MHGAHEFLLNLALVLCVAGVSTFVFQRVRQPLVLGYLLAGLLVGPHASLPFVQVDEATVQVLSELGVILLMFFLGLEFDLSKVTRIGPRSGLIAIIETSLTGWLGFVAGRLFGWSVLECVFLGAAVAISSTTIVVKAFTEIDERGPVKDVVFGILIAEDLIAIFLIALLTPLSPSASLSLGVLGGTAMRLLLFLGFLLVAGLMVVPRVMRAVVALNRPETLVVASVGLCFAFALLAQAVGYSVALGAFVAGALVSESGEADNVSMLVRPLRDIFAAIFFVAVGMLIDPAAIAAHWPLVLTITAVVVTGKVLGITLGTFLSGMGIPTAVRSGMSLAQIGEFSFIIAAIGVASGAGHSDLYAVAVAVSVLTTMLTPMMISASDPAARFVDRHLPKPFQTFAALYGSWLEELSSRPREATRMRRIRRLVSFILVDAAMIVGMVFAASLSAPTVGRVLGSLLPAAEDFTWVAVIVTAIAASTPFALGMARCIVALSNLIATTALPLPSENVDFADAPRSALLATLRISLALLVGIPMIAFTQPLLPALPGLVFVFVVIGVLLFGFWRSVGSLQEHTRAGAQAMAEALARQSRAPAHSGKSVTELDRLNTFLPGLGSPVAVRIEKSSAAVGQTLAELNLRGRSGATVLAIVRKDDSVTIPTGGEVLAEGDLLAVAGTANAVAVARELLEEAPT